jgi:hypothetical protein
MIIAKDTESLIQRFIAKSVLEFKPADYLLFRA